MKAFIITVGSFTAKISSDHRWSMLEQGKGVIYLSIAIPNCSDLYSIMLDHVPKP